MKSVKILKTAVNIVRRRPFIMFWNVTHRCNLRCKFCRAWQDKKDEMDLDECRTAIANMEKIGITAVNFDGGEPLLRKDLEKIARLCKNRGMLVTLNTNGTLITESRAGKMVDVFDSICVSIDGFADTHDSIRGKGTFSRAMKGLNHLLDKKGKTLVGTSTVVTKDNINETIELANHMKSLGTDFFGQCPVNDPYPVDIDIPKIKKSLHPRKEDYEKYVKDLRELKQKYGSFILSSDRFIDLIPQHFSEGVKICDVGKFSLFLDSSGTVCACPAFRKPLFSILDNELVEKCLENRGMYDAEFEKIKNVCPGCHNGCTTDISLRCRFPNYLIEPFKQLPLIIRGVRS